MRRNFDFLGLKSSNNKVVTTQFFDTIKIKPEQGVEKVRQRAEAKKINLRYYPDGEHVGVSLDETVTSQDLNDLFEIFNCKEDAVNLCSFFFLYVKTLY